MSNSKKKKPPTSLLIKGSELANSAPSPDALAFITSLADAYKEKQVSKREIAKIDAQRAVLIENIREHYSFYREIFDKVFAERRTAIDKAFAVIDRGIDKGDNEIIVGGLQALGNIVSSSPFQNVDALRQAIGSGTTIEI